MVPLLAIWLRLLTWLPQKKMVARPPMVSRHPMVPLLAIWLRSLSMLAKKNVCTTSYGCAPGNMVASDNLATAKKNGCATSYGPSYMGALKTDEIQTIN